MIRTRLAALACAAALAAPARAAAGTGASGRAADAAPGAPRPKVVALRFAWPADLAADVTYARTRIVDGRPSVVVEVSHGRLSVAPRGADRAVRYVDWRAIDGSPAADQVLRAAERVALVVGEDGRVRSVEGIPEAVDAMRKVPPLDDGSAGAAKALELAPAALEKEARERWAVLVGFWTENDLQVGEAYETASEVPVAAVPGATVRVHVEVRAARWLDCPGTRARCVELKMRSQPDRVDAQRVVSALAERLGAPPQAVQGALGDLATVTEATVVTEPSTLVPHRLELRKAAQTGPGAAPSSRVDVQTWTYAYPSARP